MNQGQKGVYCFNNLSQFEGLVHGISTRSFGSMKDAGEINFQNIQRFLKVLTASPGQIVLAEQIHSGNVQLITKFSSEVLKNVDGLITAKKNIFLGIVTADCLPLLFYDPKTQIVGAAHGGYKGLSKHIIKHMVQQFRALGSSVQDIFVDIGPGIGVCCYEVSQDRIELFWKLFPEYKEYFVKRNGKFFLDLTKIALFNLFDEGISETHIAVADVCTKDSPKEFFSYRNEGEAAGRFISVIGIKGKV